MDFKAAPNFGFEQELLSKRLDCQHTQLMTLGSKQWIVIQGHVYSPQESGIGIFWKSFATRKADVWSSVCLKSRSISVQSQRFWWLQDKYRKSVRCQKTATLNFSLVPTLSFPETCFAGKCRSGPTASHLSASLKVSAKAQEEDAVLAWCSN